MKKTVTAVNAASLFESADAQARIAKLPERLMPWYDTNKRDLPWRGDSDPYRVFLSEIMLQQTRVEAVKEKYLAFLAACPTVGSLAAADPETVSKLWEGLGYYSRAKNLQAAAKQIVAEYGGVFPDTAEGLRRLKGVGEYTAGAVASIAFGRVAPAVDGNVLRVLTRVTEADCDIGRAETKKAAAELLRPVYPSGRAGDFTQSLMELGAVVCLPNGAPDCINCPLSDICRARSNNTTALFPVKAKKSERRKEKRTVFLLYADGRFALHKRADSGLLAGMWQFYNVSGSLDAIAAAACLQREGIAVSEITELADCLHIFTHVEWRLTRYFVRCDRACGDFVWADAEQLQNKYALPTAFRKCLIGTEIFLTQ